MDERLKDRKIFTLHLTRADKNGANERENHQRRSSIPDMPRPTNLFTQEVEEEEKEAVLPPMRAFQESLPKLGVDRGYADASEGSVCKDLRVEHEHKETHVWWQRQEFEKEPVLTPNSNLELDGLSDSQLISRRQNTSEMLHQYNSPSPADSFGSAKGSIQSSHKEKGEMTSPKRLRKPRESIFGSKKAILKKSTEKPELTLFVPQKDTEKPDSSSDDEMQA